MICMRNFLSTKFLLGGGNFECNIAANKKEQRHSE